MKRISTIGIDLAKNVFQVCGTDKKGKVIFNKKVSRIKLLSTIEKLDKTENFLVAMAEAPDVFCFPYENCIFKMAISVIFFGNLFVVSIEKCSLHHVGNLCCHGVLWRSASCSENSS